jgi:hypothetical protein
MVIGLKAFDKYPRLFRSWQACFARLGRWYSTFRNMPLTFPIPQCLSALVLAAAVLVTPALAASHAEGFAKDVTGGGQVAAVRPATPAALQKALCASFDPRGNCTDDTPRVIALDHTFDFRGSVVSDGSATVTEAGCMANACPQGGGQWAIDGANHFCQSKPPATVTYDKAGVAAFEDRFEQDPYRHRGSCRYPGHGVGHRQRLSGDDYRPRDASVLEAFKTYRQYLVAPQPADIARIAVRRDAGAGHLDLASH